jgi:hypothetical protein
MKTSMLIAAFSLLALFTAPACKKHCGDQHFQSKAQIGEADLRKCSCCGGYFITIDGEQYRFLALPVNSGINLETEPRPVNVELNWHREATGNCSNELIVIEDIRKL